MNKTAIVYNSVYGSTKQYALWLSKDLKLKLLEMNAVKQNDLKNYDTLIVMSGTYGGRMPLTYFLTKNWESLKNKKIIVVAVGAVPENSWWSKISYMLIPRYIRKSIKYYKIQGKYKEQGEPIRKENLDRVIKEIK